LTVGIPSTLRHNLIDDYCKMVDGILIMGGEDVYPELYGEEIDPRSKPQMPRRDNFEAALIKTAHQLGIPILGVCRGLQIMNVAFGGSLYQDIEDYDTQGAERVNHSQIGELDFSTSHPVEVVWDTLLHKLLGKSEIITNTCHHQAAKEIGAGLRVSACSSDGIVEAIESSEAKKFTLAVQWHPEVWPHDPVSQSLFSGFCRAADKRCGKR